MALEESKLPKFLPTTLVKDILDETFDTLNESPQNYELNASLEVSKLSAEGIRFQREIFEEALRVKPN